MTEILKNLLRIKSIITLAVITALVVLVISHPESAEYRTAFISAISAVLAYYFNKDTKDTTPTNPTRPVSFVRPQTSPQPVENSNRPIQK